MPDADIQLVCFDLGGVIVRLAGNWGECCRAVGAPVKNIFAENGAELAPPAEAFDTGKMDDQAFAAEISRLFPDYSAQMVLDILDVWLAGTYPGSGDLIEDIHASGVTTACLSNTNPRHWALMTGGSEPYEPVGKMNHHFASHLIGAVKPDDAPYEYVEMALDLDPTTIVFFDDRLENIKAAHQRGWRAFLIDQYDDPIRQMEWFLCNVGVL